MAHNTYSFTDITATLSHPSYGSYSLNGDGTGDMTVSKATDRTVHDVAADGHIMVSKVAGNNGSVVINAQQSSGLHNWLQGLFNYLVGASTKEWAQLTMNINSPVMHKTYVCTGGAFVKEPDEPFQAQGQRVAWTILFADIQKLPM